MRIQRTAPAILAAALLLPACSGDGPTAIEIPLASVEIISPCPFLDEGATCVMAARGITAEGQLVTNAILRWSSSASSIVGVNSEGRVFGISPGKATILVEAALGEGFDTTVVSVRPCTKC